MDSASQTNIYRSFPTLRFCVTPIRSFVDKIVTSSRVFLQQECACFLVGPGACGLWPISSLVNLELIIGETGAESNIQLPGILKIHPNVLSLFLIFAPNGDMITQTLHGISIDPYFQHHTSFISNGNSSLHPRGVSLIPR